MGDTGRYRFCNAVSRALAIRLVPPGGVIPPFTASPGFGFTPAAPAVFNAVLFTTRCPDGVSPDCVRDPSQIVTSHLWDFGDGQSGSGPSPNHSYQSAGTYPVTLTIGDAHGRSARATRSVVVSGGTPPTAVLSVSPTDPKEGDRVFFNGSGSTAAPGRTLASHAWDFGDGSRASGVTTSHAYQVEGTYVATLNVTDDRGQVGTATATVTVTATGPDAQFVFSPTDPSDGQTVFLTPAGLTLGRDERSSPTAGTSAMAARRQSDPRPTTSTRVTALSRRNSRSPTTPARSTRALKRSSSVLKHRGESILRKTPRVVGAARGESLDALLVTHLPNVAYLTGLQATAGALLVTEQLADLVTDSRYLTVANALAESSSAPRGLRVVPVEQSYDETIRVLLAGAGPSRVAVEAEHVSLRRWTWLSNALRGSKVTLLPTEGLVEAERIVKDEEEIQRFRQAGRLIAQTVERILQFVRPGRSELEIAADVDHTLASVGFEDRAFPTIVASGPNSALPHARPSQRRLATGDLVLLDFGGVSGGYCVDLSRTVCVGAASEETTRLHAAVVEAQQAALAAVRPGVVASDIDAAARSTLARHDLSDAFGHGTGHGLGLEIHEAPRIGQTGQPGAEVIVEAGMVFTIEPGVYVPGVGA